MNAAEWKRLVRPLVPAEELWAFRGKLCYRQPLSHVLVGSLGEGSQTGGTYVWRVSMPLFVPSETLTLSHSERVAPLIAADDTEGLNSAVLRSFRGIVDEAEALRALVDGVGDGRNLRAVEAAAYGLILRGEAPRARELLAAAREPIEGPAWLDEVAQRMRSVDTLLASDKTTAAVEQLAEWERSTISALRLDNAQ